LAKENENFTPLRTDHLRSRGRSVSCREGLWPRLPRSWLAAIVRWIFSALVGNVAGRFSGANRSRGRWPLTRWTECVPIRSVGRRPPTGRLDLRKV